MTAGMHTHICIPRRLSDTWACVALKAHRGVPTKAIPARPKPQAPVGKNRVCDVCHGAGSRPRTDYVNVSDAAAWIKRLCPGCAARFDHARRRQKSPELG
jgi:cytochrome c5